MATKKTTSPKVHPKSAKGRRTVVKKETRNGAVYTTYSDGTTEGKAIRHAGRSVGTPKKTAVQKATETAQKKIKSAKYEKAKEKEVLAKATPQAKAMNRAVKRKQTVNKLKSKLK